MKNCTKSGCKIVRKVEKDKNALHFMQNGRIIYANDCINYMNKRPGGENREVLWGGGAKKRGRKDREKEQLAF